jgi:hypothetical protein
MPAKVGISLVGMFLVMQVIGELLEFKGKVVPEFVKIRKYFLRKNQEKKQVHDTLQQVQTLLNEVNQHYSKDNITKRNEWMKWVDSRAEVYDASVSELTELKEALAANNELTLDLYINVNRNRIIDFASKITNEKTIVSREEFNRIFKVYHDYESILKKYHRTNGEVDIAYRIIIESYEEHMKHHTFLEDVRGYHD